MDALQELDLIEARWQLKAKRRALIWKVLEALAIVGYVVLMIVMVVCAWNDTARAETNDVTVALQAARDYRLSPFQTRALLCLRQVENGGPGREYGVLAAGADRDQATQARWAAGSIRKRLQTALQLETFAARWAPEDADPLNRHWLGNMRACLARLGDA